MADVFWKMQRKTQYSIFGVDTMPLSLKNLLLNVTKYEKVFLVLSLHHKIDEIIVRHHDTYKLADWDFVEFIWKFEI